MVWLFHNGVAISENGVAISLWCGYFILVWLFTKMVWLFHLAFLGLLVGAKNFNSVECYGFNLNSIFEARVSSK